jgi:uncharacterized protein
MTIVEPSGTRMLPRLTDANRAFWTGGAKGQLLVPHCEACDRWVPPPAGVCPDCGSQTAPRAVSGRGTVFTWTVNAHQFHPEIPPPNLIAIVVLDEQEDLRVATNLVDCEESEVRCGMPVEVLFEDHGEVFYPLFRPVAPR